MMSGKYFNPPSPILNKKVCDCMFYYYYYVFFNLMIDKINYAIKIF